MPPASDGADRARIRALMEIGRWTQAIELLSDLLAVDPEDASLLGALAECQLNDDRPDDALETTERLLHVAPDALIGLVLRTQALVRLGEAREAIASAEAAVHNEPASVTARRNLCLALLAANHVKAARETAESLAALDPNDPGSQGVIGLVALRSFKPARAEAAFRRQLAMTPDDPCALNNLGTALMRTGHKQEALDLFVRAASVSPQTPLYRRNIALAGRAVRGLAVKKYALGLLLVVVALLTVSALVGQLDVGIGLAIGVAVPAGIPLPIIALEQRKKRVDVGPGVDAAIRDYPMYRSRHALVAVAIFGGIGLAFLLFGPGALLLLVPAFMAMIVRAHRRPVTLL